MFLDEVDKIGSVPGIHQLRDVGGEGVQQVYIIDIIYHISQFCSCTDTFFMPCLFVHLDRVCLNSLREPL